MICHVPHPTVAARRSACTRQAGAAKDEAAAPHRPRHPRTGCLWRFASRFLVVPRGHDTHTGSRSGARRRQKWRSLPRGMRWLPSCFCLPLSLLLHLLIWTSRHFVHSKNRPHQSHRHRGPKCRHPDSRHLLPSALGNYQHVMHHARPVDLAAGRAQQAVCPLHVGVTCVKYGALNRAEFLSRRFNELGYGWQVDGQLRWQGILVLVTTVISLIIMGRDWVAPQVCHVSLSSSPDLSLCGGRIARQGAAQPATVFEVVPSSWPDGSVDSASSTVPTSAQRSARPSPAFVLRTKQPPRALFKPTFR